MATISLYAGTINQMPGLIKDAKRSVESFKDDLKDVYRKALNVDKSVCDLSDVISSLQSSTRIQEERITALEKFQKDSEEFIRETVRIDNAAANAVNQNKNDFYEKYSYLKPDCEKSRWEKIREAFAKVGEWCKEHWKLIVTVVLVIVAAVVVVLSAGTALGPLATILVGMAKGLLSGALMGGLVGGISSAVTGGSFLDGFENGAFSGALMGALMGGVGALGTVLGGSCSFAGTALGRLFDTVLPALGKIAGGISSIMGLFDIAAFGLSLLDPNNAITQLNKKFHESKVYNLFQITLSTLAVFAGGFIQGSQNRACFVAGTLVLTTRGLIAIENIKSGDKVISTDIDTGSTKEKTVIEIFRRVVTELVCLKIGAELIKTTNDHLFYIVPKGFISARNLQVNDVLLNNNHERRQVDSISFESTESPITVYNLKVEEYHDYYVGNSCVLVHNADYPSHMNEDGTLKPNTEYTSGEYDYTYKTNSDGYIESVHADELYLKKHEGRLPHNSNTSGKLSTDHAGHLIGDLFGGSPKLDNLVSQDGYLNTHQYREMERMWQDALKNGQKVTGVNIKVSYPPNSSRPNGFIVSYKIDGIPIGNKFKQ